MSENILALAGISNRMKSLCSNCQWLQNDFAQCKENRKGFDCTKYQIKSDIEEKRSTDMSLNNPYRWINPNGKRGKI
jgi:hypothetical protein